MRCPYCFGSLPGYPEQCPHCNSRLPARKEQAATRAEPEEVQIQRELPLTGQQAVALVGGIVIVLACLCASAVGLANPRLLPQPVIAVFPALASPTPLPTLQVTRAPLPTRPADEWQDHVNRRGDFTIAFPAHWLVIDQGRPGWQREVDELAETYAWLPALLNASEVPRAPRTRATDPTLVNPDEQQLVRFSAGETDLLAPDLAFAEIETIVRTEPERLTQLVGVAHSAPSNLRFNREEISGREALLVEFLTSVVIAEKPIPIRVRTYFLPVRERLYVLSYMADEPTMVSTRDTFERIANSFTVEK